MNNRSPLYYRLFFSLGLSVFLLSNTQASTRTTALNTAKSFAENTAKSFDPSMNMTDIVPSEKEMKSQEKDQDIHFSADEIENNQESSTITAKGHVEIIRDNLTLFADKVTYNQEKDIVTANGDVVLVEKDGNVIFSDEVVLTDKMTQGEMQNIKVIMKDKTRIAAKSFRRGKKDKKIMSNVIYTPCDVCKNEDPLWQIKAKKIEHNAETQDIHYQNAYLEIKGVPVLYTPFLSHPDPTVKRRSGFLFPKLSTNSYLGAAIQPRYFWSISDQENILFNPILTSDKGVVAGAEYKKYFYRGDLSASGSYLRDPDNKDERGNLFLKGRY